MVYNWIKKLDSRFHGNDAKGIRLLCYAKAACNDRKNTPRPFGTPLLIEGSFLKLESFGVGGNFRFFKIL